MGEGYEALARDEPRRSWMGVAWPQTQFCDCDLTPTQPSLGGMAAKLRYPSPIKGEKNLSSPLAFLLRSD